MVPRLLSKKIEEFCIQTSKGLSEQKKSLSASLGPFFSLALPAVPVERWGEGLLLPLRIQTEEGGDLTHPAPSPRPPTDGGGGPKGPLPPLLSKKEEERQVERRVTLTSVVVAKGSPLPLYFCGRPHGVKKIAFLGQCLCVSGRCVPTQHSPTDILEYVEMTVQRKLCFYFF